MVCEFVWRNVIVRWTIGLIAIVLCGSAASAQIVLQPSQQADATTAPTTSPFESSRRQKPVSRESTNDFREQSLQQAVTADLSDRESSISSCWRRRTAMSRQLSLVRRIVRFASPSIVHIEATKEVEADKGSQAVALRKPGAGVIVNSAVLRTC